MSASGSRPARAAVRLVLGHVFRTTRGLPDAIARDRFDQVASDVWEQGADADRRGGSGLALAVALLTRAIAGVPADLVWRHGELVRARRAHRGLVAARTLRPLTVGRAFDQTNGAVDFGDAGMHDPNDPLAAIERRSGPAGVVAAGFMGIGM